MTLIARSCRREHNILCLERFISFVVWGPKPPCLSTAICGPHMPETLPFKQSMFVRVFQSIGCVQNGYLSQIWHTCRLILLLFNATKCKVTKALRVKCLICSGLLSCSDLSGLTRIILIKPQSVCLGGTKPNQDHVCIRISTHFSPQKQNIQGPRNYTVAEKKPCFSQCRQGEGVLKKADLAHSGDGNTTI